MCAVQSALIRGLGTSFSLNMTGYSPQMRHQGRGDSGFSLSRLPTAQTPCLARMVGAGTNDCGCPTEPVRQNDFTRCVWRVVSQIRKFPKNPFTFSVFLTGFVHFGGNFRREPPPEVCAPQPPSLLFRLGPSAIARNLCSSPLMRRARRRITDSSTALQSREYIHGKWTRPAA